MRVHKHRRPLKITLLTLAVLIMALLCHASFSPYSLLPGFLRYSAYPVTQLSYEGLLQPGDLVICDKSDKTVLRQGAVVKYVYHMMGGFTGQGAIFGRVFLYEEEVDNYFDIYRVNINYNGENFNALSARPEYAAYRIAGLGNFVLALYARRYLVVSVCGAVTLLYIIVMAATRKSRKLKQVREEYIRMFDHYALQYAKEPDDV